MRNLEREFTLGVLDRNWAQHLLEMESMRIVCNSDPKPDDRLEEYQLTRQLTTHCRSRVAVGARLDPDATASSA